MKNLYKIIKKSVDKIKTKWYNKEVVTEGDIKQKRVHWKVNNILWETREPKRFETINLRLTIIKIKVDRNKNE